jgi:protein SCO1/2
MIQEPARSLPPRTIAILVGLFLVAIAAGIGAGVWLNDSGTSSPTDAAVGGPFRLTAHDGRTVTEADFKGMPVLLFFGFTHCPDICPTTLADVSEVLERLGPDAGKVQALFVSVDPERDTLPRLKEYVEHFGLNAVAVTGSKEQLDPLVKQYAAYYEKQASDSAMGYLVDHTSRLYLIGPDGRIRYLFRYGEDAKTIAAGVRQVLAATAPATE